MTEQQVTKTTIEHRDVITLFVVVNGQQVLTRPFRSPWFKQGDPGQDPNYLGRQVELEFRSFCKEWGVKKASALTVYETEERTTRSITETDVKSTEIIRNTIEHEEASA